MGAWGTGIFDNDTTCDVRDCFYELLEDGLSASEATEDILSEYTEDADEEELSLIYIGLAAAQLEKKVLQEKVQVRTIELIDSGADLELWSEDGEDEAFFERKQVLEELRARLIAV